MESEPMLTPREKSPLPEKKKLSQRRIEPTTLHHAGRWAQHTTDRAIPAPFRHTSQRRSHSETFPTSHAGEHGTEDRLLPAEVKWGPSVLRSLCPSPSPVCLPSSKGRSGMRGEGGGGGGGGGMEADMYGRLTANRPSQLPVCLLVACLTSQQQTIVYLRDGSAQTIFTCCHTEIEVADQTFYLTQSQYTDTGPTGPSADIILPGAWQGRHWSANFSVPGVTRPRKNPFTSRVRTPDLPLSRRTS